MAVRKIIRMGHPTLRKVARRAAKRANWRAPRSAGSSIDMIDTLNDSGGIGLAAPQVDEPVRLAIIEIDGGPEPLRRDTVDAVDGVRESDASKWSIPQRPAIGKAVCRCRDCAATSSGRSSCACRIRI